ERELYFAGSVERRAHEFHGTWQRDDVAEIVCVRGGYGSNYLLETLNFDLFTSNPKILVGCSDITTLLTAIHDRTGLVTFHGPMVAKDIAGVTLDFASWNISLQGASDWLVQTNGVETLRPGRGRGKLYGGCLSMLVAS